jgi:AAA domain
MVFWRAKSVKPAAAEQPSGEEPVTGAAPVEAAKTESALAANSGETVTLKGESAEHVTVAAPVSTTAKIISLLPARLSDRLAEVGGKDEADGSAAKEVAADNPSAGSKAGTTLETVKASVSAISTRDHGRDAARELTALRAVIADMSAGSHVLVLGPAGHGRRSAALKIAEEIAKTRPDPPDWIYTASSGHVDVLRPHAVPAGTGERVVRDIQDALAKSSAMLNRLIASDSHQMTLAVLEEEHRHRSDGGLDQLKRRAEAQNIALVKTSEGFVLAPMHEGRVVRADVFRALPEALQRDVETKVTGFEAELQALLVALPGNEVAVDDRHLALAHEVAERAVKPNLGVARKFFSNEQAVSMVFDAIEADWMRQAVEVVRRPGGAASVPIASLHAVSGAGDGGAPVVLARSAGARDLLGEIGFGSSGRIAVQPGHLARANGGFLIIDAWRLAVEPQGWAALSAALETGSLQPVAGPGIAVATEPVPLNVKLILIAENESLAKLKEIDPRTEQYFGAVVRYDGAVTALEAAQ